jgi:hypothetical protein
MMPSIFQAGFFAPRFSYSVQFALPLNLPMLYWLKELCETINRENDGGGRDPKDNKKENSEVRWHREDCRVNIIITAFWIEFFVSAEKSRIEGRMG